MKNFFYCFFFLTPNLLIAQTYISGLINSNTTWTSNNSPYIVTGNTLVTSGNTLIIEPGVIVKFDTSKVLQIDGELIAIGNLESRITFTSNQVAPSPGDWGKIQFSDTCADAIYNNNNQYVSGSVMKYCDILYGGGIDYGAIHISFASPHFSNCRISSSETDGIYCWKQNFYIDSSLISNCLNFGISYNCLPADSSKLFIHADTLANNSMGGIYIGTGSCGVEYLELTNCTFYQNSYSGAFKSESHIQGGIIAENNFINNNSSGYLYGTIFHASASNFIVNCNRFINNISGGMETFSLGNNVWGPGTNY